ncbi:MAG: GH32 C-terminal domain-containing protein [Tepidisphaeraceae bacterium]|jgi:fructan beta-fructosidase
MRNTLVVLGIAILILAPRGFCADDIVIADFEGDTYGDWTVEGTAFGKGPAHGTLPGQMPVSGFAGKGLVNSFNGGDDSTGTLTSPAFTISRKYLTFLIGGGGFPGKTCMNLLIDGKVVRTATGPNTQPGGSEALEPASWDVQDLAGKSARIQIVDAATGGWGHINVDEIVLSDTRPATVLTNPILRLTADKQYLHLPVRNGAKLRHVKFAVDEKTDREFTIELADDRPDWYAFIDITAFRGRSITLTVDKLPDSSKALSLVDQSDTLKNAGDLYAEAGRPQFHFTSRRGWLNDPNGLVFYKGKWHLFYQHNPFGTQWGNMHWGHADSDDLFHWRETGDALVPDSLGTMFSGSAVVDWNNTSGFGRGNEKPLVLIYTAAGNPFTQCLAYSADAGATWTKYDKNPVLRNISGGNRDPKVFWHKATNRWIMALYVGINEKQPDGKNKEVHTIHFHSSANLKEWTFLSRLDGFFECPDIFELPVIRSPGESRWVIFAADGAYMLGQFDGTRFIPETPKLPGHFGGNSYAAQTYADAPDGRRILIGWMSGGQFPGMPFNQQMSLPMELSLHKTPEGLRLCKAPVAELDKLAGNERVIRNVTVTPGRNPLAEITGDTLDIVATIEPGQAKSVGMDIRGQRISWSSADSKLHMLGKSASCPLYDGRLQLRIVVDRASIEVFADNGAVYLPFSITLKPDDRGIGFFTEGGDATILGMKIRTLKSAWPAGK